jgi:sarcosine oxidase / L-pipecolate oxidase
MRLMIDAMEQWRSNPLYSPYFYQTGYLRADLSSFSEDSIKTYRKLGVRNDTEFLTPTEVRKRFPQLSTTNFDGADKVFWHPGAGWADAEGALIAVTQAAVDAGVVYKVASVEKLLINSKGVCTGALLDNGQELVADSVLLTVGAATAITLAETAPKQAEIQAGDRVAAAGACSFYVRVEGEQREKFRGLPVIKSCLKHTKGEGMSMTPDGVCKFNCDLSFTNLTFHPPTGKELSIPPDCPNHYGWTGKFPKLLIERCRQTLKGLYGDEASNLEIEGYRMCWYVTPITNFTAISSSQYYGDLELLTSFSNARDAETPYHDFLITPHPKVPHLSIATGGSFHGWKFLPVIGDYIAAMLDGKLAPEYGRRWAWDAQPPSNGYMANPTYQTETDLSSLLDAKDDEKAAFHGMGDMNGLAA